MIVEIKYFASAAVCFGGRAIGVEFHRAAIVVNSVAPVAEFAVGIAEEIESASTAVGVAAESRNSLREGADGIVDLAVGDKLLDVLKIDNHRGKVKK